MRKKIQALQIHLMSTNRVHAIIAAGIAAFFWGTRFAPDKFYLTVIGSGANYAILVVAALIALAPRDK
jgi:ATP-dependent protease HslVU (ClpYQ) peptidase subunit